MADLVELANSYYRLLRWVEGSDAEKKNTALRSLDRIKRFLNESNVEVIDLTGQPFNAGWAVTVLKMDDSVPENELVFTKMVKPIIQVNGDVSQQGEVYVGKPETPETEINKPVSEEVASTADAATTEQSPVEASKENAEQKKTSITDCVKTAYEKIKGLKVTPLQWTIGGFGVAALLVIILIACILGGQNRINDNVTAVGKRVDVNGSSQQKSAVTYEIRNGDDTIIVTQPIGESVISTVDINGVPVTISTNTDNTVYEGE